MVADCPYCGQPMPGDPLQAECHRLGIGIRFPDLVSEAGAAQLLGYRPDTLRKQATEQRNTLNFTRRGNRRFYSLAAIAAYIENAENAEKAVNFGMARSRPGRDNGA